MVASTINSVAGTFRRSPSATLLTLSLGVLIAQIDSSVVNLAVKRIGTDLAAGISALQWVLDAYNLAYATFLLSAGTLGDLYGRRRLFLLGIALVILGSLVCGLAPGIDTLIAGRAMTGLGAALVIPNSLALLAMAYPEAKERSRALGIWASCNGLALAIGPTVGGLLVEHAGWRSIFLLIVPVCVLALVMGATAVAESAHPEGRRLDPVGQVLAMLALGALAFAFIEGAHRGWSAGPVLRAVLLCLLSFGMLLAVEHGQQGAILPLGLFRRRRFSAALAVAGLMTFGIYGMLFLLPVYLQAARAQSVFTVGIELLPASATFILVSALTGRLAARFGQRILMTGGTALMGSGLWLLASLSPTSPLSVMVIGLFIIGIGLGLNTGPVLNVAVSSVPAERSGTASGLVNTARMVGATLGIAVMGAVFANAAGQGTSDAASIAHGMSAAFVLGGAGEWVGALLAWRFARDRG